MGFWQLPISTLKTSFCLDTVFSISTNKKKVLSNSIYFYLIKISCTDRIFLICRFLIAQRSHFQFTIIKI